MLSRQLYICDIEPVYLKRLAIYLNRHPGFLWRIKTSTSIETCMNEHPDVLLVSGRALEDIPDLECIESYRGFSGCRVILLEDDSKKFEYFPAIQKYQSARKVYESLLELLGEQAKHHTSIIGVYGAESGLEAEYRSIDIAEAEREKGEVLILPFTEYTNLKDDIAEGDGLEEWFYYRSQEQGTPRRISDYVYTVGETDYVRSFRTVYDMKEVSLDLWHCFYEEELKKSRYRTILLIFDHLPEHLELFFWCDEIRVIWGKGSDGKMRKQQFKEMAVYMGMSELMDKILEG